MANLVVVLLVCVLSLGGCQRKSPPAPVEVGHGVAGGQPYALDLENAGVTTNNAAREPLGSQDKSYPHKEKQEKQDPKPVETHPDRPDFVIVKEGETLYSIASQYKMSGAEIITINNLQAPYRLEVGQKLYLKKSALQSPGADHEKPSGTGDFIWPVRGRIVSNYGEDGNEGVNIAAPQNTPVYATKDGKITYTGSDLEDFGKLILITHGEDWRSAYAHLSQISVQQGEQVQRGQVIGYVGHSGNVKTPQLHFELRKGSGGVNPNDYVK